MAALAVAKRAWVLPASLLLFTAPVLGAPSYEQFQVSSCRGNNDYNPLPGVATDTGAPTVGIEWIDYNGLRIGPGPLEHSTNYPGLVALWQFDYLPGQNGVSAFPTLTASDLSGTFTPSGTSGTVTTYVQCGGMNSSETDTDNTNSAHTACSLTPYYLNGMVSYYSGSPYALPQTLDTGVGMAPYVLSDDSSRSMLQMYGSGGYQETYYSSHSGDNEGLTEAPGSSFWASSGTVQFQNNFNGNGNCVWSTPAGCSPEIGDIFGTTYLYYNNCTNAEYDDGCDNHTITDEYTYNLPSIVTSPTGGSGSPGTNRAGFTGSQNQYMRLASGNGYFSLTSFSYEAWVNPSGVNPGNNPIMGQGSGEQEAYIGIDGNGGSNNGKFMAWAGNGSATTTIYANAAAQTGAWYLVTATYLAQSVISSGTLSLYVNGLLQSSATVNWPGPGTNGYFQLGGDLENEFFSGYLNDVMVNSVALTPQEVAADYDPTFFQFSESAAGMGTAASYFFGPYPNLPSSLISYVGGTPSVNPDTASEVTANLQMNNGGSNYVGMAAQDSNQQSNSVQFNVTVATSAPAAPSVSAFGGISTSAVQWNLSESYVCNEHLFNIATTVPGTTTSCPSNASGSPDCRTYHSVLPQPSTASFILNGLTPNQPVGLVAQTQTAYYGTSALTATVTSYSEATIPYALAPTIVNLSSMTLGWNANGNPAYTPFELSDSSGNPTFATDLSTPIAFSSVYTATTAVLTGLAPQTTYYFRVRAENGNGGYPGGGQTTSFNTVVDGTVPYPTLAYPPAVTAVGDSTASVQWSWSAVPTAQTYSIYDVTGMTQVCSPNSSLTFDYNSSYGFCLGLANGGALTTNVRVGLRFRTNNLSGGGPLSSAVYKYTLAQPPTNLTQTGISSTTLTLGWNGNNNPAYTAYQLVYSLDPAFSALDTSTQSAAATSMTLSGLFPGATYYFQVRALNGDGVATTSAGPLSAVAPLAPGQTQSALPPNSAANVTGSDGQTQVNVPSGSLANGATIYISVNPLTAPILVNPTYLKDSLSLTPNNQDYISGSAREFVAMVDNQVSSAPFSTPFTIRLPFSDVINPGFVDGSNPAIPVGTLKAYTLDPYVSQWDSVPSSVNEPDSVVLVSASHFSVYALFGTPLLQPSGTQDVRVFPQPWEPGSGGKYDNATTAEGPSGLVFQELPDGSTVKIYTLLGELVRTLSSIVDSGCSCNIAVWDGNNSSGHKVASGVYLAYISGNGSSKVVKVAIER